MLDDQFISYLQDPAKLGTASLVKLDRWRKEFPFCQTLHLMYLLNLYIENDISFEKQLRSLAATVADRAKLKSWIEYLDGYKREMQKEESKPVVDPAENIRLQKDLDELESRILEEMNKLEERRAALRDLIREKEQILTNKPLPGDEKPVEKEETKPAKALPKDRLLEEFLQEQEKKRPAFFNPAESARKSITDQGDIVSETLAQVYAKQGNNKKAIEIYKALSLKFPEKSSYFAAQIERLKN